MFNPGDFSRILPPPQRRPYRPRWVGVVQPDHGALQLVGLSTTGHAAWTKLAQWVRAHWDLWQLEESEPCPRSNAALVRLMTESDEERWEAFSVHAVKQP